MIFTKSGRRYVVTGSPRARCCYVHCVGDMAVPVFIKGRAAAVKLDRRQWYGLVSAQAVTP